MAKKTGTAKQTPKADELYLSAAQKIVDELIEREPRLKAARETTRSAHRIDESSARDTLKAFRQRLKD